MNTYATISNFGASPSPSPQANPLSYCALSGLESGFMHTLGSGSGLMGPDNSQCQVFMGEYCANNWDGVCEYLSNDTKKGAYPITMQPAAGPQSGSCFGSSMSSLLTKGQVLLRNAAATKYLKAMSGNCKPAYQPFDPTVAESPLIRTWYAEDQGKCIPYYAVDPKTIDNDVVMNKLLTQPWVAMDVLTNIYNNLLNTNQLDSLKGTKLYNFFSTPNFQSIAKGGLYNIT